MKLILMAFLIGLSSHVHGELLSFEDALKLIIERDTTLPVLHSELETSTLQAQARRLGFLPSLRTSVQQSRSYEFDQRQRTMGLTAELNLFRGGSDLSLLKAADNSRQAADYRLQNRALEVEREGVVALLQFVEIRLRETIYLELEKINQRSLEMMMERSRRGLVPEEEVLKAEIDFQNSKAQRLATEVELERRKAALTEALGHDSLEVRWPFYDQLKQPVEEGVRQVDNAFEGRPDLQNLKHQLMASNESVKAAKRDYFPKVDLSHSWSRFGRDSFDSNDRTLLLSLNFPLFEGWRTKTLIAERSTQHQRAMYEFTRGQRRVVSELVESKENLLRLIETALDRERTLGLAKRVFDANFRRYQEGRASVNDLQIDQGRLLESQLLANRGWLEAHLSIVDFCHARGIPLFNCKSLLFRP
jgi:outer membrane protein TolC